MAQVQTNYISTTIPLSCFTRQGCRLSPLLSALAIELPAVAIRSHSSISSKWVGEITHKILLYADDALLYFTEPETSVPVLFETLAECSTVSGYKINLTKS